MNIERPSVTYWSTTKSAQERWLHCGVEEERW
jgi:hypothetical protein